MRFFGTDGIRDRAGEGALSPDNVRRIGRALARFAATYDRPARVGVGRDPRPSGPALTAEIAAGLAAEGATVEDLGVLPTPAVAWATATRGYDLGIAISASHNPEPDNGVKPFAAAGRKLTEEEEDRIEALLAGIGPEPVPAVAPTLAPAAGPYVRATTPWLAAEGDLKGWNLVVDCAAGAAGATAPPVLTALGASVEWIHLAGTRPINEGGGTEHPERWQDEIRRGRADGGLAFDGDGDRVLVADATGEILDGDALLALLAEDLLERRALTPALVVTTVMSNLGLEERLGKLGVRVERVAVGDRHVAKRMRETGAVLGGEPSGHLVLPRDGVLFGDGLVAGVRVLQAAGRLGRTLSTLRKDLPRYPQLLRNVRVAAKRPLDDWPALQRAMSEAKASLGQRGRLVVRYSGTEPLLRIMAEGRERDAVERAVRLVEAAAQGL